jgi:predicted acylesterase/phospholipase RssA
MAGGGFHFGYYLGIYAAMCESGKQPDVLLASCGGAIAASLIQAIPDNETRIAWLSSPEMYEYWRGLKSTRKARVTRAVAHAMKRRMFGKDAHVVPDLFHDYMFDIPAQLPLPVCTKKYIDVAIVAGKMNYDEREIGHLRDGRKLFSETIFCESRAADLLRGMSSPLNHPMFGDNAIAPELLTDVNMPIADAVRASISDMYYFRCHSHESGNYIGGVIDLFPIEVASRLADNVIMELKGGYDEMFGIPAIRTVLGFHGNERLNHVLAQQAEAWVDTSDMEKYFARQRIHQKIIWAKNKIQIVTPPTHEQYVGMIRAQWEFGYQRAKLGSGKN